MAKAFSVASWNVRHFKSGGTTSRVEDVVAFVKQQKPDVFAFYEVEGKDVFSEVKAKMPTYSFHITEGSQVQEILLGVAPTLTAFFTQRTEFNSGVSLLRPGALLTVTVAGKDYPMLFLHTKSGDDPRGLGLRDDMLVRAFDFRRALDKAAGGRANYMFMGDLNHDGDGVRLRPRPRHRPLEGTTQGSTPGKGAQDAHAEQGSAAHLVGRKRLLAPRLEPRPRDRGGARPVQSINGADVTVRGWPEKQTQQQKDAWINKYSDHALLYFEVQKV